MTPGQTLSALEVLDHKWNIVSIYLEEQEHYGKNFMTGHQEECHITT